MSTPPVELTESDVTAIIEAFQKPDRTVAMFGAVTRIKDAARRKAIEDVAAVMDLSYEYVADLVERQAGR